MFGYVIALVAGTLTALFVGSLWYSPLLFGEQWMKLTKLTPKKIEKAGTAPMVSALVMALLRAVVLCILFVLLVPAGITEVISIGFIAWFGFVVPEHVNTVVWAGQPKELLYINAFSALLMIMAQGIVIWYVLQSFSVELLG